MTHLSTILNISLHRQRETKYNIDNMTWLNMQYIYMAYNYSILCHLHLQFSFSFTVYFSNAMHTASFAGSEGHSLHTCQHLCLTKCGDSCSVSFKAAKYCISRREFVICTKSYFLLPHTFSQQYAHNHKHAKILTFQLY